jgi:hypothetical protein
VGVGTSYGADGEAEVANDSVVTDQDERPGRVDVFGRRSMAADPAVEIVLARGEGCDVVLGAEAFEPKARSDQSPGSFGFERTSSVSSGCQVAIESSRLRTASQLRALRWRTNFGAARTA